MMRLCPGATRTCSRLGDGLHGRVTVLIVPVQELRRGRHVPVLQGHAVDIVHVQPVVTVVAFAGLGASQLCWLRVQWR